MKVFKIHVLRGKGVLENLCKLLALPVHVRVVCWWKLNHFDSHVWYRLYIHVWYFSNDFYDLLNISAFIFFVLIVIVLMRSIVQVNIFFYLYVLVLYWQCDGIGIAWIIKKIWEIMKFWHYLFIYEKSFFNQFGIKKLLYFTNFTNSLFSIFTIVKDLPTT